MRSRMIAAGACGFTLVELMVSIMIFGGVAGAGYTMYVSQQQSYVRQEQVAELQQNMRAALYYIETDLRMAGYDPTENAGAGITTANTGELTFTADIGRARPSASSTDASYDSMPDGIINSAAAALKITEQTRFALQNDANHDGVPDDNLATVLGKEFNGSGGLQPMIEDVERLEFVYHLSDGTAATSVNAANLSSIRLVTVSLLVRTHSRFGTFEKDMYFYPGSNPNRDTSGKRWGPFNDSFMRRLVITNIKLRNMGLIVNS